MKVEEYCDGYLEIFRVAMSDIICLYIRSFIHVVGWLICSAFS
jgi:hypothetical protein